MSSLVNISNLDSTNLLSRKSLFIEEPTIAYNGNSGVGEITNEKVNNPIGLSYKMFEVQNVTTGLFSTFSFGEALEFTAVSKGNHLFSFATIQGVWASSPDYFVNVNLNVYINGLLEHSFTNQLQSLGEDTYKRFVQSFNLEIGDVVNFEFDVQRDSIGTPNPNIEIYFTNFCLNYNRYGRYTLPFDYYENESVDFILIESVSDFPTAVGGVITLEDNKTYYITKTIDLNGSRLVGGANTTILGSSSENSILTSTGLGVGVPLLSSIYTTPIRHIAINDVDTAIEFDGATNPDEMALDWTGVNFVNVPNVGTIKKASNFIFDKGAFLNSKGLKFDGEIGTVGFGNCLFIGDGLAGDLITVLATADITRRFRIIYSSIVAFSSTNGINVSGDANIQQESYILDTINFSGGGTYLVGTNHTSERSLFINCVGIVNTESLGSMYMKNNATETVITVQNDRYNIAGTTQVNGINQRFIHDSANNALEYTGIRSKVFHINLTFTISPETNNQKYGIYIGVNKGGAIDPDADRISESEAYINTPQAGRADAASIQALVQLDPTDKVYMIVQNTTSTANIIVEFMNLVIK